MIRMFDADQSGLIRLDEFHKLWDFLSQWRVFFTALDKDNTGKIDKNEFRGCLQQMGYT